MEPSSLYDYHLPESLIATQPASPRDSARLFVYDTARDEITLDHFSHLGLYLPERSLLACNDTKVVPARAMLKKETGGKIEALFLMNEWDRSGPIPAIVDRKTIPGATLSFFDDAAPDAQRSFRVARQEENIFYLEPLFPAGEIFALLERYGTTPIPRYIKHPDLDEPALRERYQSVFGTHPASVAAPTASLHFTPELIESLSARYGVSRAFVTLHVGLGTFAPVSEEHIAKGMLHAEFFNIPAESRAAIRAQKEAGRPVVAVGTTVVRALESAATDILAPAPADAISGSTRIFIRPPYDFKIADALITNFHLPGTSLLMLVQAFLDHKGAKRNLMDLYRIAIQERFRFYSFGDGMLIK